MARTRVHLLCAALIAAIDGFKVSVEASQSEWKGGFDYGYWGPQIYLTARF